MRKNSPRKWLHACLDLLPVILIPVFMIYSHRHDVTQDFDVVTPTPVYYETNEINDVDDFVVGNAYYWTDNWNINDVIYDGPTTIFFSVQMLDNKFNSTGYADFYLLTNKHIYVQYRADDNTLQYEMIENRPFHFLFRSFSPNKDLAPQYLLDRVIPTQYIKEYQDVVTTIPQDVMTSFMDRFNNTIDNYFNMGNVFNLTGVYDWFNTNIFNGNAPQIIYSVWNIALYELVMDLLFLLYGLFMWFIDMVQHLMDKPFKSIK